MGLVLTYTNKVRQAMKQQASIGVDLILLVGIAGIVAALALMSVAGTSRPIRHVRLLVVVGGTSDVARLGQNGANDPFETCAVPNCCLAIYLRSPFRWLQIPDVIDRYRRVL